MPNDTVRASATALPIPNRRLFLATGTAAAVFATVKRAAGSTGTVDPIFAAIEEHRLTRSAAYNGSEDGSEEMQDLEEEQLQALGRIEPTTLAGAVALLSYMVEVEGCFADENSPLVPSIHSVIAALQKLRGA
jgi:hypothetical protein